MKLILIIGFNQLKEIARWKKYLLKNKKWILKDMNVLENDSINKHTKKSRSILKDKGKSQILIHQQKLDET